MVVARTCRSLRSKPVFRPISQNPVRERIVLYALRAQTSDAEFCSCGRCSSPASMRCYRWYAPSVAGKCVSSPSSATALTSGKYWSTSEWMQSHRASPRHAGHRRGTGAMRPWVRVPTSSRIGMKQPNHRRTLRSISASVGNGGNSGVVNATGQGCTWHRPKRFIPTNLGRLAPNKRSGRPRLKACDAQNMGHNCPLAVGFPMRIRDVVTAEALLDTRHPTPDTRHMGRFSVSAEEGGAIRCDYVTGQYRPPEYRAGAPRFLASVPWDYSRE